MSETLKFEKPIETTFRLSYNYANKAGDNTTIDSLRSDVSRTGIMCRAIIKTKNGLAWKYGWLDASWFTCFSGKSFIHKEK